ncbi:hypothetical protein T440DRAFT_518273 [Plenodomus tracheiphilus IPT5]|uniref:Protein kinase domain-containing protein n=1 Tax=Plenodomus tracheiphilus IPT5 TaxID=1408161 RepID=A0A6A7B858_9PLEO|nr:hypothetical protein T440DRAFT_518273 [Plenodomus tracheiphilus IPT5]
MRRSCGEEFVVRFAWANDQDQDEDAAAAVTSPRGVRREDKMPQSLAADHGETSRSRSRQRARTEVSEHRSMWERLHFQKIGSWLRKDDDHTPPLSPSLPQDKGFKAEPVPAKKEESRPHSSGGLLNRRTSRRVVPGLPRPLTFKRMNSERRDKLLEVPLEVEQRRATSNDRRESTTATKRSLSPPSLSVPSMSAPDVLSPHLTESLHTQSSNLEPTIGGGPDSNIPAGARQVDFTMPGAQDYMPAHHPPPLDLIDSFSEHDSHHSGSDMDDIRLQEELEAKWILNLSMHFRDMSDREKFFITYAEEPNKWRRVTVSCDYRRLEPESLESDLKTLHYQRDKSSRIYEAIRDSLPDIQFYETVTNLKLETTDGRLHVHVTEDVNEIIPYPSLSAIEHLDCKRFKETAVSFDSHISGFVYKVSVNNRLYIKKEIPGPDAVEEFLYEINALCSLHESKSVIRFEGIIVDEQNELIKGLLISYAEQGALVDMIYDYKPTGQLHWERRERWARQIVQGLSEIHEAGFVQGDFTLSNIVIDGNDDAKIIDINRRGCPVGWEPPELARLIESGQRISIYIGVKSDLYQLGMVLWALAEQQDEPERQERPLTRSLNRHNTDVPVYFRDIIRACLSDTPRARPSAANLLKEFPDRIEEPKVKKHVALRDSVSTHRSDKEYIDPATAVDLEDISQHRRNSRQHSSFENITVPPTEYPASSGSYIMANGVGDRSRSPGLPRSISRNQRSDGSPYTGHRSVMSFDDSEMENELASLPASRETRWEQIYVDGDTKLVQRGGLDINVHDFATQEPKEICITTPPGEMENTVVANNVSDNDPLKLSTVTGLHPIASDVAGSSQGSERNDHHRSVGSKASFSDRVHQLANFQTQHAVPDEAPPHYQRSPQFPDSTTLAEIEHELSMDSSVSSTAPPSRVSTGFSIFDRAARVGTGFSIAQGHHVPLHQDSGFSELERIPSDNQQIRHSLDSSVQSLQMFDEEDDIIKERLWVEKGSSGFGPGVRSAQLEFNPATIPIFTIPASPSKSKTQSSASHAPPPASSVGPSNVLRVDDLQDKNLEEKISNTTIRPPSITIPSFHHSIPTTNNVGSPSLPSGTSDTPMFSARSTQRHSYYDAEVIPACDDDNDNLTSSLSDEEKKERAAHDLSGYLSHTISFPQQPSTGFYSRHQS